LIATRQEPSVQISKAALLHTVRARCSGSVALRASPSGREPDQRSNLQDPQLRGKQRPVAPL